MPWTFVKKKWKGKSRWELSLPKKHLTQLLLTSKLNIELRKKNWLVGMFEELHCMAQ